MFVKSATTAFYSHRDKPAGRWRGGKTFLKEYRDNYITMTISDLSSNQVSIFKGPFNYRLLVSEGDFYRWMALLCLLDCVISWCKQEGLLVIFDMHGAPGGQTGDNIDDSWGYPFLFGNQSQI